MEHRRRSQLLRKPRHPLVNLFRVGAGERVLILRAAQPRRNLDVLHRPKIDHDAGNGRDRPLQPFDDRGHRCFALVARAQRDGEPPGIRRGVDRRHPDDGHDAGHVGILADRALDGCLQPLHLGERDLLPAFHDREDEARVLQRQEPLGNDDVEPDRRNERGAGHDERQRLVAQHPVQAAPVEFDRAIDRAVKYPRDAGARGVRPLMPQ